MFDFVRDNTRLMLGLLVLLIIPSFIFFGVEGYKGFNDGANAKVAVVDGQKISQAEWDTTHRQQAENARRQNPALDASVFDQPAAKYDTLEQLVRQRVLFAESQRQTLVVSDAQVQREILAIPQLASLRRPDGSIDVDVYRAMLSAQGLTPEGFESSVRQDLVLRRVLAPVAETPFTPPLLTAQVLKSLLEQRSIRWERFGVDGTLSKVKPSEDELKAYHQRRADDFKTQEEAEIEYLVLDASALAAQVSVSADDLRKYYDENIAQFTKAEERRARHILVKVPPGANAEAKAKAKSKAEGLLAELRKAPQRFVELAKTQSDDSGSAAQGGDLDFFGRGAMVKAFEDAAFAMKVGEISPVVESEFGFHIIKLEAVRGGERQSFESVKVGLEATVRKQQAQKKYAEAAEQFSNLVFEQSDSLQPAADKFQLKIQHATVGRRPALPAPSEPALASPKLLAAVFSDEALKNKRNTEALELGQNRLVSARVRQHRPAALQPFDTVRAQVLEAVKLEQATALAKKDGEARLAQVQAEPKLFDSAKTMVVSRDLNGVPREVVEGVLKADAKALPQVLGIDMGSNGYLVVRLDEVKAPPADALTVKMWGPRLAQLWSGAEARYYLDQLQRRHKADIKVSKPAAAAS